MEIPFTVDINEMSKTDRKEQFWEVGDKAERKIVNGESVFIEEEDRVRFKEILLKSGVDLNKIEGRTNPLYWKPPEYFGQQSEGLMEALGKDRLMNFIQKSVVELNRSKGGEVQKKTGSSVFINDENDETISAFIHDFLANNKKIEQSWQQNTVLRIEALLSATDKLLWIIKANSEAEAVTRMEEQGTKRLLKERVLRGCEKAGEVIPQTTERVDRDKPIRHLPKRGISVILEQLATV